MNEREAVDRVRKLLALSQSDNEYEAALALGRALRYLDEDRTIIGRAFGSRSMNDYWRDNETISPVAKWYGSDLCGLDSGIEKLAGFLARH